MAVILLLSFVEIYREITFEIPPEIPLRIYLNIISRNSLKIPLGKRRATLEIPQEILKMIVEIRLKNPLLKHVPQ